MVKTSTKQQTNLQLEDIGDHITSIAADSVNLGLNFDCVLRTSTGAEIFCHKIILAMASDFLREILWSTMNEEMVYVTIPDVKSEILEAIIGLVYSGEICISCGDREEFLKICRLLKLKAIESDIKKGDVDVDEVEEEDNMEEEEEELVMEITKGEAEPGQETRFVVAHEMFPDDLDDEQMEDEKVYNFTIGKTEQNLLVALKEPAVKIEVTENMKEQLVKRLETLIQKSYTAWDSVQGPQVAEKDHKIRLVTQGKTLLKGFYVCVLCNKEISVVYTTGQQGKFKQWVNSNMKRHLLRIHSQKTKDKNK